MPSCKQCIKRKFNTCPGDKKVCEKYYPYKPVKIVWCVRNQYFKSMAVCECCPHYEECFKHE